MGPSNSAVGGFLNEALPPCLYEPPVSVLSFVSEPPGSP